MNSVSLFYNCVHFAYKFLPHWDKPEPKRNILHRHTACYSWISEYKDIYIKSNLLSKAHLASTGSGNLEFLELKYLKISSLTAIQIFIILIY